MKLPVYSSRTRGFDGRIFVVRTVNRSHHCQTDKQHKLTQPNQRPVLKPNNKGKKKTAQARKAKLNFTSVVDIQEGAPLMMGTFSIQGKPIRILFDSGATHSLMNGKTLSKFGLDSCNTNKAFTIKTTGGNISSEHVTRGYPWN
jgi:hypothetical protein